MCTARLTAVLSVGIYQNRKNSCKQREKEYERWKRKKIICLTSLLLLALHCRSRLAWLCSPSVTEVDLLESLVTRHSAEQIRGLIKFWWQNSRTVFVVEIVWGFDSRANKFPQSVNKSEWSLLDLDSSDSSASDGLACWWFALLCFLRPFLHWKF